MAKVELAVVLKTVELTPAAEKLKDKIKGTYSLMSNDKVLATQNFNGFSTEQSLSQETQKAALELGRRLQGDLMLNLGLA